MPAPPGGEQGWASAGSGVPGVGGGVPRPYTEAHGRGASAWMEHGGASRPSDLVHGSAMVRAQRCCAPT